MSETLLSRELAPYVANKPMLHYAHPQWALAALSTDTAELLASTVGKVASLELVNSAKTIPVALATTVCFVRLNLDLVALSTDFAERRRTSFLLVEFLADRR